MVYDCFPFFNELDILEVRLNELDSVVDKFVLVEANRTHQNQPKEFIFEQNKERFAKFSDKIIHVKLTKYPVFIPIIKPFSSWKLEIFQRDMIVKGLVNCKPDDIILISDLDEIPSSEVISARIKQGVTEIFGLRMDMFMYFFNNKLVFDESSHMTKAQSIDGIWHCTALLPYKLLKKTPSRLRKIIKRTPRKGAVYPIIKNAGWHFTYIGGVKQIIKKLEAFAHTEYNHAQYKDENSIRELIENGKDLFGRDLEFEIVDDSALPRYLQKPDVREKWEKLFLNKTAR